MITNPELMVSSSSPGAPLLPDDALRMKTWLSELFAPWVQALQLQPASYTSGKVSFNLPVNAQVAREGGVLCGQAMMAAADTAMVIALLSQWGEFRPLTTLSMTTQFMRAVSAESVLVQAEVTKPGRSVAFAEAKLLTPDGKLAAQFVASFALL